MKSLCLILKMKWSPTHQLTLMSTSILTFVLLFQYLDWVEASKESHENGTDTQFSSETSFLDWKQWRKKYWSCNPKKNPSTSPIDIFSSTTENAEDFQTLVIYSNEPSEDVYFLSTFYDVDGVQLESFNIKLQGDTVLRDATYISGLDSATHRFLKGVLIMFTPPDNDKEALHKRQSFHIIDDKEYQMEIMFIFATQMGLERTQIHVLVELTEEENPVWKPILDMFPELVEKIINETCFGDEHLHIAQENLEKAEMIYKETLIKQKNETEGLTYKKTVKELTALAGILKGAGEEAMENLTRQQLDALVRQHECRQESIAVDEEIKSLENESTTNLPDNDVIGKEATFRGLKAQRSNLMSCIQEEGEKAKQLENEWSRQSKLLRKVRIGNETTDVFQSVQYVLNLLNEMKSKLEELEKVEKAYEAARYEIESLKSMPRRSVFIKDPFQISWLFPSHGGFYSYNGSSPVPPCKGASNVIVLETPITISKEQLKQFQEFPSISQTNSTQIEKLCQLKAEGKSNNSDPILELISGMEKIRLQVPPIKPLGERTVRYNPKNIIFREDDGVHMKSRTRRKLIELATKKNSSEKTKGLVIVTLYTLYISLLL